MPAPGSQEEGGNPLDSFSAPTRAWFEASFEAPTPAQRLGWQAIARGEHTLILAPTGSGKTLAAFLWALDRLHVSPRAPVVHTEPASAAAKRTRASQKRPVGGVRVLYISPLKALIYDVERNLRSPLIGIAREAARQGLSVPDVSVATRTGDTTQAERSRIAKQPPDILVTTPESLYLLLTSQARTILSGVEAIIVDEIHALAGTKRGAHLALSLERLEQLVAAAGNPGPQRVGLSATQRPLEEIARFLGGQSLDPSTAKWAPRKVAIVDTGVRKQLDLQIIVPVEDMAELGRPVLGADGEPVMNGAAAANPEERSSIWPSIYPRLLELIRTHTSTLVFVNSRRLAERLATKLNELAGEELVRAHHGSVAREQRLDIEEALKAGRLPALVATSSLELGIDMGAIDLVVQVEAPSSVSSGLQRIGRAGHQVGEPSKGRLFPKYRGDLVSSAVVARRMIDGLVETTTVPRNPIDVLCQQIVALVASGEDGKTGSRATVDDVTAMARGAYPFVGITDDVITGLLDLLSGRYPSDEFAELRPRLTWDRLDGTLRARPGARMLAITSGGTIPDRGLYSVTTPEGTKVGELDEEMVFESRVGETFLLGASTWRIEDITADRVVVTPAPGIPGKMPFWHGDKIGRPFELGKAIGEFVRNAEHLDDTVLMHDYGLDPLATSNLRAYLQDEREATGNSLPTDRQLVVQRFRDELGDWQLCLLSPFGAQVHAPWAMAIEARIRDRLGMEARAIWSDDGIVVRLPEADEAPPVDYVLVDPDELDDLLMAELPGSALFASRFRENAARALLLPRRRPGTRTPLWRQRQRSADLLKVAARYSSFPILLETYRECLRDIFDVPSLTQLLKDIRSRKVRVVSLDMAAPSPFASSLAFGYIANFMYDGDAPLAERRAAALALDRDLLAELLGSEELRELIEPGALVSIEAELQCLDPRRNARGIDGVHDLLRRLGDLSSEELAMRCNTGAVLADRAVVALVRERRAVSIRVAGEDRLIAAEDAGRFREALGVQVPPGLPSAFLTWESGDPADPTDPEGALASLLVRYARTHGPFITADVSLRFGIALDIAEKTLLRLGDRGRLLSGAFRPDGHGDDAREWCDVDVLRSLRQRSLALLRKEIEPTSTEALARFLPDWHGIGAAATGGGLDRLVEVIGQLQGIAVPASTLERDILPVRIQRYQPRMLDELLASGEVVWVGSGPLGHDDGRISLYLRSQARLLVPAGVSPGETSPSDPEHHRLREVLAVRGACFFRELQSNNDLTTIECLWDLVWSGEVTNDSLHALRALVGSKRAARAVSSAGSGGTRRAGRPRLASLTALGPPKAQGRWSLVSRELGIADRSPAVLRADDPRTDDQRTDALRPDLRTDSQRTDSQYTDSQRTDNLRTDSKRTDSQHPDNLRKDNQRADTEIVDGLRADGHHSKRERLAAERAEATERLHARAVTLLERHGVLTRESVRGEGVAGGFAALYPVLKSLEEAGRVRRGYFVAGLGGAQFAVPGAVDRLRAFREPPGEPHVVALAAVDPANAYGLALPWPVKGPQRAAGAYVLLVDGLPSLYVEKGGRSLVALRGFDGTWEEPALQALCDMVGADDTQGKPFRFRRLALEAYPHGMGALLKAKGFVPTPKGLTLHG